MPLNAEDTGDSGLIPGSGRSPEVGSGYPLQLSCMENSIDRGAWWATVYMRQKVGHNWATEHAQPCTVEVS